MARFLRVYEEHQPALIFRLDDPSRYRVGRRYDADIPLRNTAVSRQHCVLDVANDRIRLTDTGSRNGTYVNNARVSFPIEVGPGDVLRLAGVRIEILDHPGISDREYRSLRNATTLLAFLPGHGSNRKLRLIARAWFDKVVGIFATEKLRRVADAAVEFADGALTPEDLTRMRDEARDEADTLPIVGVFERGPLMLAEPVARDAVEGLSNTLRALFGIQGIEALMAGLVRDVLDDFLRPLQPEEEWLAWNDGTVRAVARGIYDSQDFGSMPILADALEDAGCTDERILSHCRAGLMHVRGCWLLDGLLGLQQTRTPEAEGAVTLVPW